jgi:hypothetical protein
MMLMKGQSEIPQIVNAIGASRRFPGGLDGGQKQCDEHANNRDHHQKLYQRETSL